LRRLLENAGDHEALAIASYNAGPVAVSEWLDGSHPRELDEFVENVPYRETRGYVRRVLAHLAMYRRYYDGENQVFDRPIPERSHQSITF
jgi:soluble lytic murein transglycosylase